MWDGFAWLPFDRVMVYGGIGVGESRFVPCILWVGFAFICGFVGFVLVPYGIVVCFDWVFGSGLFLRYLIVGVVRILVGMGLSV